MEFKLAGGGFFVKSKLKLELFTPIIRDD